MVNKEIVKRLIRISTFNTLINCFPQGVLETGVITQTAESIANAVTEKIESYIISDEDATYT